MSWRSVLKAKVPPQYPQNPQNRGARDNFGDCEDIGDDLSASALSRNRDWLTAWRELASLVYGITEADLHFQRVSELLDRCDNAYLQGDWPGFLRAAALVRQAVAGGGDQ